MVGVFVQVNEWSRKARSNPIGYVICENGCWEWVGNTNALGYSNIMLKGKCTKGHRYVYEMTRGPIPPGRTLDHLCRNPTCVNPDHLEVVSLQVNIMRGKGVGVINGAKMRCPKGHSLTPDNLVLSRLRRGVRLCLACNRDYQYAYHRRHRATA